jgi:MFS family permease
LLALCCHAQFWRWVKQVIFRLRSKRPLNIFPKHERSFATGIFNSGANIGAILAPLTVPWIAAKFGWQTAFIAIGAMGFAWMLFWEILYDKPRTSAPHE